MFISILGESGVGKETLVRIIRDGTWAKKNFEVSVKYIMPPDSSTEDLLNQVYDRACKEAPGHPEEEGIDIADKLRHLLAKKKYLLILGGISSITILNCMAASLPDDRNGSRVVLILEPESKEVADHADYNLNLSNVNSIHELSRLGESESGFLFGLRVFGAKEKEEEDMETYKKMVYQITGGHPLAIVVLAGLLRSKEKPVEWDAVLQQLQPAGEEEAAQDFELAREKPADNVGLHLHLLRLQQQIMSMSPPAAREPKPKLSNRMAIERIFSSSFDDLPQDIKSCFLYFAAYPKNIAHPANQIVQMWTAEGFIRPHKGKTMEQLGHSYLKELVTRCLVELDAMNTHGGIELVRVHNRLLVFLQSEAREASFIEVHDTIDVLAPASVRRLSIQNDSGSYTTFTTTKFPKLRSFICRVEESKSQGAGPKQKYDLKFLSGSKFLRVLSVQGLNITALPDEIGDMIHLRYLRVDCPNLMKLPSSIRKLVNLQTLDISETQVKEIDIMFWLIKTLRHVLANRLMLPASIETQQLLDNLQTLHGVTFAEDGRKEAQPSCGFSKKVKPPAQGKREEATGKYYLLDKMTKLRSLEIYGFQHHAAAALESALRKMHLLGHLKLVGDEIPSFVFIEPSLRCLHTMVLDGKINWPTDATTLDVQKARPNLVSLEAQNLPEHENIRTKLERIKKMRTNETR